MSRLPSVKTLSRVFDNAKEARRILEMSRAELLELPAGAARDRECYSAPKTWDLRMCCLDALDPGLFGVEGFQARSGDWCEYLNTGDTYAATLIRFRGRYFVASLGDIAERHGTLEG